ncbi:MAG: DUF2007 domain-containing protein [Chromatiales bacterium]|nr:DUF2007 domain-containing protein [Chromatiales bacterium]MDH4030143.1 DUF2007 domain-containing protein [Chromatiales bacterium]
MHGTAKMVCVHRLQDPIEANLIRGLLMNEDIPAELTGESLVGAYSGIPKLCDVRVLVPEQHRGPAEAIIRRYERGRAIADRDWRCSRCGEANDPSFEICWSCERARG